MKKQFSLFVLALMALMMPQTATAAVVEVSSGEALYKALCQGMKPNGTPLADDDVITLMKDFTFQFGGGIGSYFYVSSGVTRNLDLNGHTFRHDCMDKNYLFVIEMGGHSVLNIYDKAGGGKIVNNSLTDFTNTDVPNAAIQPGHSFGLNSRVIDMSRGDENVLNIYGGELLAQCQGTISKKGSAVYCNSLNVYSVNDKLVADESKAKTHTVNVYGGHLSNLVNTFSGPSYDNMKVTWNTAYFCNPKVSFNLYGGTIGQDGSNYSALKYLRGFQGELKEGVVYGIASEDHLNNFSGLGEGVDIYVNGVKTTVSAASSKDLSNSKVEFKFAPPLTVAGQPVTKDNCDDILAWEEYKISFDFSTNTLYLKSLQANVMNTIEGNIVFDDFTLNIVVDGKWTLNGRIVGHNGNLVISAAHQQIFDESEADLLSINASSTPISLNGKNFTAKHRVRVLIDANNQPAISCGNFAINSAWLRATGKAPVVDCESQMLMRSKIDEGSLSESLVRIIPVFQSYLLVLKKNIDEAGTLKVNPDGYSAYPEGMDVTVSVTEKSGYKFLRWDDNNEKMTRTVTMNKDIVLTALFEQEEVIRYYNVSVVSADETMGTVSGGGTNLQEGTVINITATPKSGYQFLYWTTANGQVQGKQETWTVTKDETLTAHFRKIPDPNDYLMWVCGTQVSTTNASDILGDGVWLYDHASRTLITMKDATYNLVQKDFVQDWITNAGQLTMVINHNITVTTDDTEATSISMGALLSTQGLTIHIAKNKRLDLTAKNMYPLQANGTGLKIDGHGRVNISLQNTNDKAKTAMLLSGDPALTVDGAWMFVNVPTGCKVSNKTDDKLSVLNGEAFGSMSGTWLEISDQTPRYSVNMTATYNMDLCVYQGAGDYFEGEIVTLRALPATGYKFVAWSDGNTNNPRTFTMPAYDIYLDPIVEQDESIGGLGAIINVSAPVEQGSITGVNSGWYSAGTQLVITAVPADGYEFMEWSDGTTENPYRLTVEAGKNINIVACFHKIGEGIENIAVPEDHARKVLMDGVLYIATPDGAIYDSHGTKVR